MERTIRNADGPDPTAARRQGQQDGAGSQSQAPFRGSDSVLHPHGWTPFPHTGNLQILRHGLIVAFLGGFERPVVPLLHQ